MSLSFGGNETATDNKCMYHAMCKKPNSKSYIWNISMYIEFWKRENSRDRKKINGCQGLHIRVGITTKAHRGRLGEVLYLYGGDSMAVCYNSQDCTIKRVNFIACKIHVHNKMGKTNSAACASKVTAHIPGMQDVCTCAQTTPSGTAAIGPTHLCSSGTTGTAPNIRPL